MSETEFKIFYRVTVHYNNGQEPTNFDFDVEADAHKFGKETADKGRSGELPNVEKVTGERMGYAEIGLR